MDESLELASCSPEPIDPDGFNPNVNLPYGLTTDHIRRAMEGFVEFIGFVDSQLHTKGILRIETMLMPANFSSMVGEFMNANIPKYCSTLVKNNYHNGHPDMIPAGVFPNDSIQHTTDGIEVKGSRYLKGWQGHNPEDVWLMVFVFDSNRPVDESKGIQPKPFRFITVVCAQLTKDDWTYSGRSETSRRTITASVNRSGSDRMYANLVYRAPESGEG